MMKNGVYGYFGDDRAYLEAITWWMQTRHGWTVDPESIFTTHGAGEWVQPCALMPLPIKATVSF